MKRNCTSGSTPIACGHKQTIGQLAEHLNSLSYTHANGKPFEKPIAIGRAVYDAYWAIHTCLGEPEARPIALAFTSAQGDYLYDRKEAA
jgi:hypothetical protein